MNSELNKNFLTNRDATGRYIIYSNRTGRSYYVEPIGSRKSNWGDLNPATGKVEGSYGKKYRGAIDESESLITPENGFDNIVTLEKGVSPMAYIEDIDFKYPDK